MSFTSCGRDLGVAIVAKSASFFGDEVVAVALLLQLQSAGEGPGAAAALLMAALTPIALLAGPAGRLADRVSSRRLLGASGVLQASACLVLLFVHGTPAILTLVAVLGVGQAVNGASWSGLLPALVPREQLAGAMALAQAANTVGLIAAPAVGGLLTAWAGLGPALLLDAASFLAVAAAGWWLPGRRSTAAAKESVTGGWRIVRGDPLLRPLVFALGLLVLFLAMVNVVEVFLVRGTLGAGPVWYGVAGAAFAGGVLAGALLARRWARPAEQARALGAAAAALAAGLAAMGLAPDVAVLTALAVLTGAANGVLNVAASALVFGRSRPEEHGRVGAVVSGVASGAQLVAFVAAGALGGVLSPRAIFLIAGACALAATVPLGRRLLAATRVPAETFGQGECPPAPAPHAIG